MGHLGTIFFFGGGRGSEMLENRKCPRDINFERPLNKIKEAMQCACVRRPEGYVDGMQSHVRQCAVPPHAH